MSRFGRILIISALAIGASAYFWPGIWNESGQRNHYVHQAAAFLHGRLDVDADFEDLATYAGRKYVVFPPLPAAVLMPFVAAFGFAMKPSLLALVAAGISVALLRRILLQICDAASRSAGLPGMANSTATSPDGGLVPWLVAAFFLGTGYWPVLLQSFEAWPLAHVFAVLFLLAAIGESLGKRRAALCGLYCGLAVLCRQLSVYAAPFLLAALLPARASARAPHTSSERTEARSGALARAALFAMPLAACVLAYCWLNFARFGSPFDTGYSHMPLAGFLDARVQRYGLFHPAYVVFNLIEMFVQGFHVEFAAPNFLPVAGLDPFGTAITFASPFVLVALLARPRSAAHLSALPAEAASIDSSAPCEAAANTTCHPKPDASPIGLVCSHQAATRAEALASRTLFWAAWAGVLLVIAHACLYYNNGWRQYNTQRFSLDFLPLLMVLVGLGAPRASPHLLRAAVAYSIALNVVAIVVIPALRAWTAGL